MEFKTTAVLLAALLGVAAAQVPASTLPVLYRVDQPTSNVVVFRGANVAIAQAAGLIRGVGAGAGAGAGSGAGSGFGAGGYVAAPIPVAVYTTPAPPPPPPTTTTTEAPTTTTTEAPTTTQAPVYVPPPPPPAPLPVIYRPAPPPVVSYAPAPVVLADPEPAGPVNYNWEYAVLDDKYNDFGHKENRDGYAATGKYYVNLPDGRTQIVTYTADANGYTPVVEYSGVAQYPEAVKPTYN